MNAVERERTLQRLQASRERLRRGLHDRRSSLPAGAALMTDAGKALLRPLARQHPVALAGAAFAAGAAVVAARPWRALADSSLLAGLLSRIGAQFVAQLPLDLWLGALQDAALSYVDAGSAPMPAARADS